MWESLVTKRFCENVKRHLEKLDNSLILRTAEKVGPSRPDVIYNRV